jgi:hypothetical protein
VIFPVRGKTIDRQTENKGLAVFLLDKSEKTLYN